MSTIEFSNEFDLDELAIQSTGRSEEEKRIQMDHEIHDYNKTTKWKNMLLRVKAPPNRHTEGYSMNPNRHYFLNYTSESLNGLHLEPSVFEKDSPLSDKAFSSGIVASYKCLRPKSGSKFKSLFPKCERLHRNLVAGGYDKCPDVLLYAISILHKHSTLVLCARDTYDRSYYYFIPILRHIFMSAKKKREKIQKPPAIVQPWRKVTVRYKNRNEPAKPAILILCPFKSVYFAYNRAMRLCEGTEIKVAAISFINCAIPKDTTLLIADPMMLIPWDSVSLENVRYCVLDECDEFLRAGYTEKLNSILRKNPSSCHHSVILGFLSKKSMKFIERHFKAWTAVTCGGFPSMTMYTKHVFYKCDDADKVQLATTCILQNPDTPIIVYVKDTNVKASLVTALNQRAKPAPVSFSRSTRVIVMRDIMCGKEKERVVSDFRSLPDPVLITTDEAAGELDFGDVPVLINFDLPSDIETFVARHNCVGRTPLLPQFYSFPDKTDEALKPLHNQLMRQWKNKEGFNTPSATLISFFNIANSDLPPDLVEILNEIQESVAKILLNPRFPDGVEPIARTISVSSSSNVPSEHAKEFMGGYLLSRTSTDNLSQPGTVHKGKLDPGGVENSKVPALPKAQTAITSKFRLLSYANDSFILLDSISIML